MSKAKGERVVLHVYEPAKEGGPSIPGFGVYHTGIELSESGVEYCYAGGPNAPGSGVQQQRPKATPDASQWRYKESIDLGRTDKSAAQISALLSALSAEFAARDYDVVHRNCNHFTAEVSKRLGLKYPAHINRAATWGSFFMDNPVKDRQRKEAEKKAEEERKRDVFANTTGHSLLAPGAAQAGGAKGKTSTAALSTSNGSPVGGSGAVGKAGGAAGGGRTNPWADPNFFPGKKAPTTK